MGAEDDYGDCCRLTASEGDARFCPGCGRRLLRCAAPGCGALVAPLGHCAACIAPRLFVEKGAVLKARPGECLSVPLVLANVAASRSLSIKSVLRGDATSLARDAVPLTWTQLDAGRARAFPVAIGPIVHAGVNDLSLAVVVSASIGDVEETYVFSGDVAIQVEGPDPATVHTTINVSGTGGMVVTDPRRLRGSETGQDVGALGVRTEIALERAERYEIEHGCRGYQKLGVRIPRDAVFVYVGFPEGDTPPDGPLPQRPVIRCGRNGRTSDGRQNAQPNDLCLRIYDAFGILDREASSSISRRVCDFVLQNDRLYVRPVTDAGLSLNGEQLASGDMRVVGHGDRFTVAPGRSKTLAFVTAFNVSGDLVTAVRFEKTS
ncbi:MAG: FHA domain-containing protein [Bacteroidales bacterium]